MGDIKIWVLTGDKCDIAENIDLSCNLINKKEQIKGKVKYDIDNYFGEENDKNNLELNKKNNDSNNYLSSINMKNNYLPT